jgi:hypothetical protein
MSNLHDVLETCLQEVKKGAELEAVLERYPELAEELRPMLQASLNARRMAVSGPSAEVLQRNRAKLLQHAVRLREAERKSFIVLPAIQRWVLALVLIVLFFFSGTSLVRASSAALPGDSLYTVKRSWEGFTLAFTFGSNERELLEVEHENERLEELHELFASGRAAQVDFAGIITRENGDGWWVSNILVIVPDQVVLPGQPIQVGTAIRVFGTTSGNGIVLAQRIEVLPAGAPLPEVEQDEDELEVEVEQSEATVQPEVENSGSESGNEAPETEVTDVPSATVTPEMESITGTLTSINQDVWRIDNVRVDVGNAEIIGIPVLGALARAEGHFGADGVFVAAKIEIFNFESTINSTNDNNSDTNGEDDEPGVNINELDNSNDHNNENNDDHEDDNNNNNDEEHNDNNDNEENNNNG